MFLQKFPRATVYLIVQYVPVTRKIFLAQASRELGLLCGPVLVRQLWRHARRQAYLVHMTSTCQAILEDRAATAEGRAVREERSLRPALEPPWLLLEYPSSND